LEADIENNAWSSAIQVGEFAVVSYGMPSDSEYNTYRQADIDKYGISYNSTLWQKVYHKIHASGETGLAYKLTSSMTGNTPLFKVITEWITAGTTAKAEIDSTDVDNPTLTLYLPRTQTIELNDTVILDAGDPPDVELDDSDKTNAKLTFSLP
jgi:hypothetical protein